jgi:ATP synthase protein I
MSADDDRTPVEKREERAPGGDRSDARLDALREKLEAEKRRDAERRGLPTGGPVSGMAQALKLGSEFVAGVIVGFVIGYTIDRVFGTSPWGMIVFLLLGFAAGTLNVMRASGVVAEKFPPPNRPRGGDES